MLSSPIIPVCSSPIIPVAQSCLRQDVPVAGKRTAPVFLQAERHDAGSSRLVAVRLSAGRQHFVGSTGWAGTMLASFATPSGRRACAGRYPGDASDPSHPTSTMMSRLLRFTLVTLVAVA